MFTETDRQNARKALAFDLLCVLEEDPNKGIYTVEEIKNILRRCVDAEK